MVPSEIEAAYDCAVHYQLQDQGHKFPCKQYLTNVWEGKGNKTWKTPLLSLSDAYLFRADKLYTSHNLPCSYRKTCRNVSLAHKRKSIKQALQQIPFIATDSIYFTKT